VTGFVPGRGHLAAGGGLALGATLGLGASADAATFTVTNLSDGAAPGPAGSLRNALTQANATPAPDTVNFASGLTGTIHLASTLSMVPYPIDLQGPGADKVTISGGNSVRDLIAGCLCGAAPTFSISGLALADGAATSGGAITTLVANLSISDSVLTGNTATNTGSADAYGGAIQFVNSMAYPRTLKVSNSVISNNKVFVDTGGAVGGGIFSSYGTVQIANSTVSGNSTENGFGSGVYVSSGSLAMSGSTVSGNTSASSGGGIRLGYSTADSTISDSTIANNTGFYGAGIRLPNSQGHSLTITGSTIAGNAGSGASSSGGGLDVTNNSPHALRDTIISGNSASASPDIYDPPGLNTDVAFSLIGSPGGAHLNETVPGSNIIGQSPQLGPLAANGGPTQTMALPSTSPAVDKGSSFGLTSDQRGILRPIDFPGIANSAAAGADGADIGAFELAPASSFKLGKLQRKKKKGTALQTVKLSIPAAGKVTLKAKGIKTQTKNATANGIVKLKLIAKGKVKKALKRKGKAKLKEKVTYSPTGATPSTLAKKVKLLKR